MGLCMFDGFGRDFFLFIVCCTLSKNCAIILDSNAIIVDDAVSCQRRFLGAYVPPFRGQTVAHVDPRHRSVTGRSRRRSIADPS